MDYRTYQNLNELGCTQHLNDRLEKLTRHMATLTRMASDTKKPLDAETLQFCLSNVTDVVSDLTLLKQRIYELMPKEYSDH